MPGKIAGKIKLVVFAAVLACCAYAAAQQLTAVHTFVCKNPQDLGPCSQGGGERFDPGLGWESLWRGSKDRQGAQWSGWRPAILADTFRRIHDAA